MAEALLYVMKRSIKTFVTFRKRLTDIDKNILKQLVILPTVKENKTKSMLRKTLRRNQFLQMLQTHRLRVNRHVINRDYKTQFLKRTGERYKYTNT